MNKNIHLVGLNHRTAGVEVREKFALTNLQGFEESVLAACGLSECLALSTCNRVEIVAVAPADRPDDDVQAALLGHWAAQCGGTVDELDPHCFKHSGLDAVNHLFTVASSLDSMVMGEPQILGQLKGAYRQAVKAGTARVIVNRLLHKSFSVAKRVRTQTAVAASAVSISYAAVELAKKIFGDLSGKTALLVGAGEMAELAATHLLGAGASRLLIANRTLARAEALAQAMGGEPLGMDTLFDRLHEADIVISSTGSPTTVIRARDVKPVLKKRKFEPMFFIDIAVPRDIDPDVNQLDNVYLYDIDDMQEVVEENMAARREEAVKAGGIVDEETRAFGIWLTSLDLQPTIVGLMDRAEDIGRRELAKTLKRLGDVDDATRQALETLVLSVGQKVLHEPVSFLKRRIREEGTAERFLDMTRRLFNLDDDVIPPNAHADRRGDQPDLDGDEPPVCKPEG